MYMNNILRRFLTRPMRRLGKTVMNILIFDMASAIYCYAKGWFRESKTKKGKEEEIVNDHIWPDLKSKRRW